MNTKQKDLAKRIMCDLASFNSEISPELKKGMLSMQKDITEKQNEQGLLDGLACLLQSTSNFVEHMGVNDCENCQFHHTN